MAQTYDDPRQYQSFSTTRRNAHRGVIVQGDERIHLHPVQEDFDQDQSRRFELSSASSETVKTLDDAAFETHADSHGLDDEAEHGEPELSVGRKRHAPGDHDNNREETTVWVLEPENEGDEENGDWIECLQSLVRQKTARFVTTRGETDCTFSI